MNTEDVDMLSEETEAAFIDIDEGDTKTNVALWNEKVSYSIAVSLRCIAMCACESLKGEMEVFNGPPKETVEDTIRDIVKLAEEAKAKAKAK